MARISPAVTALMCLILGAPFCFKWNHLPRLHAALCFFLFTRRPTSKPAQKGWNEETEFLHDLYVVCGHGLTSRILYDIL